VSNDEDRLMHCFSSTFPGASRDELRTSPLESISGWDSLRGVTLLAVLDEEFGVQLELSELLELNTFEGIKRHLVQRGVAS
jgi:acyl carrier protein